MPSLAIARQRQILKCIWGIQLMLHVAVLFNSVVSKIYNTIQLVYRCSFAYIESIDIGVGAEMGDVSTSPASEV